VRKVEWNVRTIGVWDRKDALGRFKWDSILESLGFLHRGCAHHARVSFDQKSKFQEICLGSTQDGENLVGWGSCCGMHSDGIRQRYRGGTDTPNGKNFTATVVHL
jgi:hypothetical protein